MRLANPSRVTDLRGVRSIRDALRLLSDEPSAENAQDVLPEIDTLEATTGKTAARCRFEDCDGDKQALPNGADDLSRAFPR